MMQVLQNILRIIMDFFGLKAPQLPPVPGVPTVPVPLPAASQPVPAPVKPPAAPVPAPAPAPKVRRYLRLVTVGGADSDGCLKLQLQLCENIDGVQFKVVDIVPCRSGQPYHQYLRVGSASLSGSMEPLPEGYYAVGKMEFASQKWGDYSSSFSDNVGPIWAALTPKMPTERSALGIHKDLPPPSTVGCIGIPVQADVEKAVSWFKDDALAPVALTVNWDLGTVETWIKAAGHGSGHLPRPAVTHDLTAKCPNHASRNGTAIDTIVLHNTEGDLASAIARFEEPVEGGDQVSAHFIMDRDGSCTQMVAESNTAWHAGYKPTNLRSIGIESVAGGGQGTGLTEAQEKTLIAWVKYLMDVYDIHVADVVPHRSVVPTSCPGSIWPTDAEFSAWKQKHLV